jgi:IclR family pca regulon transcriptional regulator
MALLGKVRRQGYAISNEEIELGVRSIAVPIRDAAGRTIASMSLATSNSRRSLDNITDALLPELESARRMLVTLL